MYLEKGVPNKLDLEYDKTGNVQQVEILTTEDGQNHYEQITGGRLKNVEGFDVDPLEGNRELQFQLMFNSRKSIYEKKNSPETFT